MPQQKLNARKILSDTPEECMFYCHDGSVFRNIVDLRNGLENISDDTYLFHANNEKNDFSIWVRDIIGDEKLARDLLKSSGRLQAMKSVASRIDFLSARM